MGVPITTLTTSCGEWEPLTRCRRQPRQTGPNGRAYTFQNWSNQAAASQTITVNSSMVTSGYRLTANYNELSRVVVQSSPSGLTIASGRSNCVTPCNVDRPTGATFHGELRRRRSQWGTDARLDFGSWSDGGASNHAITVSQNYAVATASYQTLYQLSATSNPGNGSAFKFSPSSSDMFYKQGTQVTVTAVAESRIQVRPLERRPDR